MVKSSLDEAERIWNEVESEMVKLSNFSEPRSIVLPSRIPGHDSVVDGTAQVDDFIAIAVDLRDSTEHLIQALSARISSVTEVQRNLYETSALLPLAAMLIDTAGGRTTEYPGDGVLVLRHASNDG